MPNHVKVTAVVSVFAVLMVMFVALGWAVPGEPTWNSPTPANYFNQTSTSVTVNITATENLNQSFLEWGNSSGYTNVTMGNVSDQLTWNVTLSSLADYKYNYTVWMENTTGTWAQSTQLFVTVDTVAPTSTITTTNYLNTTDNTTTIDGTASDATSLVQRVWVSVDGGTYVTATGTASWSYTTSELANGLHNLTSKAEDYAGNNQTVPATVYFTVDTVAPSVTGIVFNDTIVKPSDNIMINVTVTDAGGSGVSVVSIANETSVVMAFLGSDIYQVTTNSSLLGCPNNGNCTLTVTANDTLGNINNTGISTELLVDNTTPVVGALITPQGLWFNNQTSLNFNFSVTDTGGSGVDACWMSVADADAGIVYGTMSGDYCNVTYSLAGTPESTGIVVNRYANDSAGNQGSNTSFTINVDNTAPTLIWTSPTPASWQGMFGPIILTFNVTDAGAGIGPGIITISANDSSPMNFSAVSNCTGTSDNYECFAAWDTSVFNNQVNTTEFNVTASDMAGNDMQNTSITLSVDGAPPTTTDNASLTWQNAPFNVTLTCGDGAGSGCNYTNYTVDNGTENIGTAPITISITTEDNHSIAYYSVDNMGNVETPKTAYAALDMTPPTALISESQMNNMSGIWIGGGEDLGFGGYVNDSGPSGILNWSLDLYNEDGSLNTTICSNTSAVDGLLCFWNTTEVCPAGFPGAGSECGNFTINLTAYDNAGNPSVVNESNTITPVLIDNIYPVINETASFTFIYNATDGSFYEASFNVSDNHLDIVAADVLDSSNYTVVGYGYLCNAAQGNNCTKPESGNFNVDWYRDIYSLNGSAVPIYYKFNFNQPENSTTHFAPVPGCIDFNGSGVYDCGQDYLNCTGPNPENCTKPYRYWLVYNLSSNGTGTLAGITQENWCDEFGCVINDTLIENGTTIFMPQEDQYNVSGNDWVHENLTGLTLYSIGDPSNLELVSTQANGSYNFWVQASDNSWASDSLWTEAFFADPNPPIINSAGVSDPDIFYSPYDGIVNIAVNATDESNISMIANLSDVNETACGNGDGTVNLTYNGTTGFFEGSCDISSFIQPNQGFEGKSIMIMARDEFYNENGAGFGIVTQDIGVPPAPPCSQWGPLTTNFSTVTNFASVNFVLQHLANLSCITPSIPSLAPNWTRTFEPVALINFTSVNMSTPEQAQNLQGLHDAFQATLTPPNQFGVNRIYFNTSYFAELNTTASITMYHLPFSSMPAVIIDVNGSSYNASTLNWSQGTGEGNLTFTVYGFSGFNFNDNRTPTITFNSPINGANLSNNTPIINVTLNGTISQISKASFILKNPSNVSTIIGMYNVSNGNITNNTANCNATSIGSELFVCILPIPTPLNDGTYTLNVSVWDLGGQDPNGPGNYNVSAVAFLVDATKPSLILISPQNGTSTSNNNVTFVFNATDNIYLEGCDLFFDNSTDDLAYFDVINMSTGTNTSTISGIGMGVHNWTVWCYDSAENFNTSDTRFFTIVPTNTSTLLNLSLSSSSVTYNTTTTATASGCPSGLNCTLYRNGTAVNSTFNGTTISDAGKLGAGSYAYVFNTSGNANYTAASLTSTLTVAQGTGNVRLYINGSYVSGAVISSNTSIWINATLLNGTGNISVYKNGTQIYSGASPAGNLTNFTAVGAYNMTAVYAGNTNYTASASTLWVNYVGGNDTIANTSTVTVNENTSSVFVGNASVLQNVVVPSTATQTVTLDMSSLLVDGNVSLGTTNVSLTRTSSAGVNYTATIPSATVITGAAGWDGKMTLPVVNTSTFSAPSGGSVGVVVDMGSSVELNFSSPVKIVIGGMAGKHAAWSRGSSLTDITTVCNSSTAPTNIDAITTRECYIDDSNGLDLVIWTYHFTSFAAYTPAAAPSAAPTPTGYTGCSITWSCAGWSSCYQNGTRYRTCTDIGTCISGSEVESENCTYIATCFDGMLNGDESDVDCGGSCGGCLDGKICRTDADCIGKCDTTTKTCYTPAPAAPPAAPPVALPKVSPVVVGIVAVVIAVAIVAALAHPKVRKILARR